MSEFEIRKDIPTPRPHGRGARRYPWREMEIGDSVFIPNENGQDSARTSARLGATLYITKPMRFTRRMEEGGVRVWRIA